MKILIVEDETILADKYYQYLSSLYEELDVCNDYKTSYQALSSESYDVCLIDYHLPDGNGLDLVKNLQNDPYFPVIVMITAYSKERIAIESLNLGVYKYLEKPVEKELLISIMKGAKENAQKRDSLNTLAQQFLLTEYAAQMLKEDYTLSSREIEVLEKTLIYGKNKLVAKELSLSQGTVRNHLSHVYQKLFLTNKDQLRDLVRQLNQRAEAK